MSLTSYRTAPPRAGCDCVIRPLFGIWGPDWLLVGCGGVCCGCWFLCSLSRRARPSGRLAFGPDRPGPTLVGLGEKSEGRVRKDPRTLLISDIYLLSSGFGRPGGDLLSHALRRSTIGAEGFHGRVRDGIGCGPLAMATRSSKPDRVWMSCSLFLLGPVRARGKSDFHVPSEGFCAPLGLCSLSRRARPSGRLAFGPLGPGPRLWALGAHRVG